MKQTLSALVHKETRRIELELKGREKGKERREILLLHLVLFAGCDRAGLELMGTKFTIAIRKWVTVNIPSDARRAKKLDVKLRILIKDARLGYANDTCSVLDS